jgi:hypothetical protein
VGGIAFFVVRLLAGNVVAGAVALLLGVVVMAAEIGVGIWLLGNRFEKLDLSQELRP